jgi:4-amino-4-deoxy-L-arabinose transferase-like glycosyltransferase
MTTAELFHVDRNPFDRIYDALIDPARRERAMVLLLAAYAAVWALYDSISNSNQDLQSDMTELIAWSRDLSFGYLKHPPLAAWVVKAWFSVIPQTDFSFYLLAMLMPASALWITWRLSASYLDIEKRILGVALLMLVPFYNFHALTFNPNTVLLPTWAATTLWFLRSYETRSKLYSALAGVGAAACMLGKYWSIFLLAGLFVAALIDSRRAAYFRSSAPWVAVGVGLIAFSPHVIWLYRHDFLPFEYADNTHAGASFVAAAYDAASYLTGAAAYVAVPAIIVFALTRPRWATIGDVIWPPDGRRRLAAAAFWGPLLLPVTVALAGRFLLTSLWSLSGWTLFPVLLLSPPAMKIQPKAVRAVLAVALTLPVVMLFVAPAVALIAQRTGATGSNANDRLLAAAVERAWGETTKQPLRFVGCNGAFEVIAYAKGRPRPLPQRSHRGVVGDKIYADERGWPRRAVEESASFDAELTRSGVALVCSVDMAKWMESGIRRAARSPASRRFDVEIVRNFLGIPGKPAHYTIFIIPPEPNR